MTRADVYRLQYGDRVHSKTPGHEQMKGTVIRFNGAFIMVAWDDGITSAVPIDLHDLLEMVNNTERKIGF